MSTFSPWLSTYIFLRFYKKEQIVFKTIIYFLKWTLPTYLLSSKFRLSLLKILSLLSPNCQTLLPALIHLTIRIQEYLFSITFGKMESQICWKFRLNNHAWRNIVYSKRHVQVFLVLHLLKKVLKLLFVKESSQTINQLILKK
jgi:hypothetical protein